MNGLTDNWLSWQDGRPARTCNGPGWAGVASLGLGVRGMNRDTKTEMPGCRMGGTSPPKPTRGSRVVPQHIVSFPA